jgi:hypothetical protein
MSKKYQQLYSNRPHEMKADGRQHAPATGRNQGFILDILKAQLPTTGNILEIASGSGEHAIYMIHQLSSKKAPRVWQPSDPSTEKQQSIAAWTKSSGTTLILSPVFIDTTEPTWAVEADDYPHEFSSILCINMIHIAPWEACLGLMAGAGRILPTGGCLYLYGPYKINGEHTAPSNADFDETLRARDPSWGIRDVNEVSGVAADNGLTFHAKHQMPANNLSLIFKKQ